MYHRFGTSDARRRLPPETFEKHLRFLCRHFKPRSLSDVVSRMCDGKPVEERTVVLTVDDGYRDFVEFAYPLIERYDVPVTVFPVSDFVENGSWLWFDAIYYLVHAARDGIHEVDLGGVSHRVDFCTNAPRDRAWETIADVCLTLDPVSRESAIRDLERDLGVSLPLSVTPDYAPLTWEQARALKHPLVEFGSHTCSHPILTRCDHARKELEIEQSKACIEARLGREVRAFCYPNGLPGDYDEESVALVRSAGYACAVVAHGGLVSGSDDPFALPRVPVSGNLHEFRARVNGVTRAWHRSDVRVFQP